MKKNALVVFGLLVSLVSAGAVFGKEVKVTNNFSMVKQDQVPVEQARKAALAKIEGTVENEYTIEDENEVVETYLFIIKQKTTDKMFEVQVDAKTGQVVSSEEQTDEPEESTEPADPAETEDPLF